MPLVLVIEDDADTREAYGSFLEFNGFSVAVAATGAEGLRAAASVRPDLILLDVTLPDTDGLTLLARFRADDQTKLVPIVGVTGHRLSAQESVGFSEVFLKPVNWEVLTQRVRQLIQTHA